MCWGAFSVAMIYFSLSLFVLLSAKMKLAKNEIGQSGTDILDLIELGAFRWLDDSPIDRRWW